MAYWFKRNGNFAEKSEFFLLDKVVKIVGRESVINEANPVEFLNVLPKMTKYYEMYMLKFIRKHTCQASRQFSCALRLCSP